MRAPKVYRVLVLITICTLLAAGRTQTNNARPAQEAGNGQDSNPKPSVPETRTAPKQAPGSANNSGQTMPDRPMGGGQKGTPINPPALGQSSPLDTKASPAAKASIPREVLFEFLFNNMSSLNRVADHDDSAGKHSMAAQWRTHDQRGAGLNDAEGQIMQEIALDCVTALKDQDVKIRAFLKKDQAQNAAGVVGPTPVELVQMFENRKKIVSDHVEKLREALGDGSFKKLDTYVHAAFHAEGVPPKPSSSPVPTNEKSAKESR